MLGLRQSLPPGSPPHTRGKLDFLYLNAISLWITPAYAGKIRSAVLAHSQPEDHPRIRGENHTQTKKGTRISGSPPHTRGKFAGLPESVQAARITPAYAGKITDETMPFFCAWDHPRIRGENKCAVLRRNLRTGSPPHTRGKYILSAVPRDLGGITPAYAGKLRLCSGQ